MVRGVPCMCMRTTPAPVEDATPAISGSPCSAVTSLMISAPASIAARATSAFEVSMDIKIRLVARMQRITGTTRLNSSSSGTLSAPGRVDSPPMSRISTPSDPILNA